ncbi:MAG: molybdopterin dinucleotide binding domain-containing protein, partial [Desulfobacterales bacterium]
EIISENVLWISENKAGELEIKDGDTVEVSSHVGSGKIKAKVTDMIHPEAVFMLHGFGHQAKSATRSYNKGLSDALLQENLTDIIGGSPALHDTFVTVKPA